MATFKTIVRGNQAFIGCSLDYDGAVNQNEMAIANSGFVTGIAKIELVSKSKVKYVIPATAPLGDVLKQGVTGERLVSMLRQIFFMVKETSDNGLVPANLLFDIDFMYYDFQNSRVYAVYQPLFRQIRHYSVAALAGTMLSSAVITDEAGRAFSMELARFLQECPNPSVDTLKKAVDRLVKNEAEEAPKPEASYDSDATVLLGNDTEKRLLIRISDGMRFDLEGDAVSLGRDAGTANCTVSGEKTVGRIHAVFYAVNGRYYIMDNESTNGTFINGERIQSDVETEIHSGDKIMLARTVLQFFVEKQ